MPKSSAPEDKAKAIKLGKRVLPALEKAELKVVAIGASAGGLEASRKLVDALPAIQEWPSYWYSILSPPIPA